MNLSQLFNLNLLHERLCKSGVTLIQHSDRILIISPATKTKPPVNTLVKKGSYEYNKLVALMEYENSI